MKHDSHIYLASKAIELLYQSIDNAVYPDGSKIKTNTKRKTRACAKKLQRLLTNHIDFVKEASWAPDDIICDKSNFHTFKLFTKKEFPNFDVKGFDKYTYENETYYRYSGGLPFKVDHFAQVISDFEKLREYNDTVQMSQLMYMYMLLSHYIVDSQVPMHCDLRDDPPSKSDKKKPEGLYFSKSIHAKLEDMWDKAITPVAIEEGHIIRSREDDSIKENEMSELVKFNFDDCGKNGMIRATVIDKNRIMRYMIDNCIKSKKRAQKIFPIDNPKKVDYTALNDLTREIVADSINILITVWLSVMAG